MHTKVLYTTLALLFFASSIFAQTGVITGKIIDTKLADVIIGATVKLDQGPAGCSSDLDGNFTLQKVPVGTHKITITYLGYATKTIEAIEVKDGQSSIVDVALEEASATLVPEVVVVATARRESMSALTILQKNSAIIADGISSETIRRTPDRTTGDVIRRVSGASIQDNKFAVIRGLNDRYNVAMLNGSMLPSTEPDRRAFSFDLFPSNILDNLVVMKTASAELPGEFAGGVIMLNTKDLPEENYTQVQVNSGYNTATTFKPHLVAQAGPTDWLGFGAGSRSLPAGFPEADVFKSLSKDERVRNSQLFENDWALENRSSAAPNAGFQIATGLVSKADKKIQSGTTIALSYNNSNRIQNASRFDYDNNGMLFDYMDTQFRNNVLWGALVNTALKINNRQKITLLSTYSTNTDNIVNSREGRDLEQERFVRATSTEYTENHLLTTRLGGEHTLGKRLLKLNWGFGFARTTRDIPSLRRMFYTKNFDAEEGEPFRAFVPFGSADPYRSGRFYAGLGENNFNGNVDFTLPFTAFDQKQTLKIGGLFQRKDRDFSARVLGFVRGRIAGFNSSLLLKPQGEIFQNENIHADGFVMDEITNASDRYDAGSDLAAAYALMDNKLGEKVRLSWGLRTEAFNQKLNSVDYTGDTIAIDKNLVSLLPSLNFTYLLNSEHQLRFSASRTVSRPEFRELAPFAFYDFYLNGNVQGNPELGAAKIDNFDVRYEWYPGQNQLVSVSGFYKKFSNPIEFTFNSQGAGTRNFWYTNIPSAQNFGVEMELRKNFDFVGQGWENLMFFANAAFIRSKLDLSNVSAFDTVRALQGQSPYILNAGLTLNLPNWGVNTTLVYNLIGDRIAQVGTVGYGDVYERHRNLLDFQISKRFGKAFELKLNFNDLLRPDFIFYQDNNANHRFDEETDNVMQRLNLGTTISLSVGYKF